MQRWTIGPVSLLLMVLGAAAPGAQGVGGFVVSGGPVTVQSGPGGPPRDIQMATGRSILRGRLTDAVTGTPLRRASVRITAPELRGMKQITTDNDGRFEATDLPAGRYNVSATKAGYVDMNFGSLGPLEPGSPVTLGDRQTLDKIDIALPRGAVITGRVLDEFGDPLIDAQVTPLRMQNAAGGRRPMPAGRMGMTNDIGEFRIYGLSPGRYYLSGTLPNRNFVVNGQPAETDRAGYAPTFYPSATTFEAAQPITVGAAETLSEITLTLLPTITARVSGTVLDAQGQAVQQGSVNAMSASMSGMMGGGFSPIVNGRFTINGLAPGDYVLRAQIGQFGQFSPPTLGQAPQFAIASVSVNGGDVDGVTLAPIVPVTLRGRFVLNGAAPSTLRPQTLRATYLPTNPMAQMMPTGPMTAGQTRDDFTFDLIAPPGEMTVRVGLPPGWLVREVRLSGRDVTDGFRLRPEEDGALEIELSDRAPTLTGTVANGRGEPVSSYSVIAFPQDPRRWTSLTPGHVGMVRPDREGRFSLRTLLPDDYYVVAVDRVQNGEWMDPEYLDRIRTTATALRLGEGDTQTLTLRLVEQPR